VCSSDLADLCRARERNRGNARMLDDRRAGLVTQAMDHIHDARGDARFRELLAQECRGRGRHLARLRDAGVPRRDGWRDLPREQIQGKIPRGNQPRDAARRAERVVDRGAAARDGIHMVRRGFGVQNRGREEADVFDSVTTAFTLSLSDPQTMRASATDNAVRPILKMKLGGEGDIERVEAVRAGAPYCRIIVDANEAWTVELYKKMVPELVKLKVEMIEQPFPANADEPLLELPKPITICADESCHDRKSLPALKDRYDMVNIKLDKTGGLTEALAMKQAAREAGFQIMVGCMVGSSLAMAPALLVAQGVELADLDGPLLLAQDRSTPLRYDGSVVYPASPELWG